MDPNSSLLIYYLNMTNSLSPYPFFFDNLFTKTKVICRLKPSWLVGLKDTLALCSYEISLLMGAVFKIELYQSWSCQLYSREHPLFDLLDILYYGSGQHVKSIENSSLTRFIWIARIISECGFGKTDQASSPNRLAP